MTEGKHYTLCPKCQSKLIDITNKEFNGVLSLCDNCIKSKDEEVCPKDRRMKERVLRKGE